MNVRNFKTEDCSIWVEQVTFTQATALITRFLNIEINGQFMTISQNHVAIMNDLNLTIPSVVFSLCFFIVYCL